VINRSIINPDVNYQGHNRKEIFSLIDRWKKLLLQHDAKKGDVIALAIMSVNLNHVAAIFACAELGMKLFLFSRPISSETLHATKMGQFGPMDFTIVEEYMWDEDYNRQMFERYGGKIIWQNEIDGIPECGEVLGEEVGPDDVFLFASTSGTTGSSSPVYVTHKDFYETALRSAKVFNIQKESVLIHNMNMHHASAMMTYLIPGLMVADTHYYGQISDRTDFGDEVLYTPEDYIKLLIEKKVTHCMCGMAAMIPLYVKIIQSFKELWTNKIIMNISGFTVPEKFYQYAKDTPFVFYSHYGSVDVNYGSPLLLNIVDENSEYQPDLLGKQPDDFFVANFDDAGVFVTSKLWKGGKRMKDRLDKVGDMYYHMGREWDDDFLKWNDELSAIIKEQHGEYSIVKGSKSFLVLWDAKTKFNFEMKTTPFTKMFGNIIYLNKKDFVVDTKIDMAQLKAYLEHHYGKV